MLETTYYALAIITMCIFLILLLGIVVFLIRVKRRIDHMRSNIIASSLRLFKKRHMEIAATMGLAIGQLLFGKAVRGFARKKKR